MVWTSVDGTGWSTVGVPIPGTSAVTGLAISPEGAVLAMAIDPGLLPQQDLLFVYRGLHPSTGP